MSNSEQQKFKKQVIADFDRGSNAAEIITKYNIQNTPNREEGKPTRKTIYNWKNEYDAKKSIDSPKVFRLSKKKQMEVKKEFENMFSVFKSKKISDMRVALRSIDNYMKNYGCTPNETQIDLLIPHIKDVELRYDILRTIFGVMEENPKIFRKVNEQKLCKKLHALLKEYEPNTYKKPTVEYLFFILGHYNDPIIVDRLVQDAEQCKPELLSRIRSYYAQKYSVKVIEECRNELFDAAQKLQREGKSDAADFIQQIVAIASKNARNPPARFKP